MAIPTIPPVSSAPSQANKRKRVQPELNLLTAIIDRLMRDLIGETATRKTQRREAIQYIFSNSDEPFSFKFICKELEFSAHFVQFVKDLARNAQRAKKTGDVTIKRKHSLRVHYNRN